MLDEKKNEIIHRIYTDRAGFGSIANTLKAVKQIDNTITYDDIKQWKENHSIRKTNLKGYNSYVADYPHQEYQVDLFFLSDLDKELEVKQIYKVGMMIIDIFSKYMVVIPLQGKSEADVAAGFMEGLPKMKKNPEVIYTDDETAFSSKEIQKNMAKYIFFCN